MGEVRKLQLDFTFDQKVLIQKMIQKDNIHASKSKHSKDQVRVLFASSKP